MRVWEKFLSHMCVRTFLNKYVLVPFHERQYLYVWEASNVCVCVYEYVLILSKHLTLPLPAQTGPWVNSDFRRRG